MLTIALFTVTSAYADLIVPGQPVCDGKAQCGDLAIVSCQASYHGQAGPECDAYKGAGYKFACETGGATVSTAYYCKLADAVPAGAATTPAVGDPATNSPAVTESAPAKTEPAPVAAAQEDSGCSTGPWPFGQLTALGIALLFVARRTR